MITIDDALNIEVSQYDTFALKFIFKNYKLDTDDKVVFSIKDTTNSNEVVYSAEFYNSGQNYVNVEVPKGALNDLQPGTYVYDLAIMNSRTNKIVTCFFPASFIIRGVAHNV